jgi:hypothetical protein
VYAATARVGVERMRLSRTLRSFLVPQTTMPMVRCDVRGGGEALAVIAATRDGRTLMMLRNFTRDESGWPVLGRITTHNRASLAIRKLESLLATPDAVADFGHINFNGPVTSPLRLALIHQDLGHVYQSHTQTRRSSTAPFRWQDSPATFESFLSIPE